MQEKTFKGYPLFFDVDNDELKAYNRLVTIRNISSDLGEGFGERYFKEIPSDEQHLLFFVAAKIKKSGLSEYLKGANFE